MDKKTQNHIQHKHKAEKKTPPTIESAGDIFAPSGNFTNY